MHFVVFICAFKGKECTDCLLRHQCVYAYVFETPIPADAQIMRKYTAALHPFILEPSTNSLKPCQNLSFGLTLIGRAADYLPYFIYAFEELGRIGIGKGRGKYELREVTEESSKGDSLPKKRVIYSGDTKLLTQTSSPIQWTYIIANSPEPPHAVSIFFITTTRIKYKNRFIKNLEFHIFFRSLLRRISLLSYFHCGQRLDDTGFKDLFETGQGN